MRASAIKPTPDVVCADCGAVMPDGKTTCKELFEEVLVRNYSDYQYARTHRLMVDAYSLQHPDVHMRSGKSFAAHLTGLCAALEYEDSAVINQAVQRWLDGARTLDKPARLPEHRGDLTIAYIHRAADAEEHHNRVREWARSIWDAWFEHHDLARQWIDAAMRGF